MSVGQCTFRPDIKEDTQSQAFLAQSDIFILQKMGGHYDSKRYCVTTEIIICKSLTPWLNYGDT